MISVPGGLFFSSEEPGSGLWVAGKPRLCDACVMPVLFKVGPSPTNEIQVL